MSKTHNEQHKKWTETYRASIISVVIMVILLIAAVICHLFGWRDAPFQFLAACLGAGVTVIITNLLLVEQTKQQDSLQKNRAIAEEELQNKVKQMELVQIKETEQYKTKLRIYQEYLEKLCDVVRDRKLDTDEKIDMQFRTAYLAMHSDVDHIEQVSSSIKDIIGSLIDPSGDKYDVEKVQRALFNIVHQFRAELYADSRAYSKDTCNGKEDNKNETNDSNAFEAIIKNFVDAFSPEGEDEMKPDMINTDNTNIWKSAVERWKKDNWTLLIDGETIRLYRPYNKDIHVQFGFWKGHYYIQAKYHNFGDFSQALKWEYKGSKTYETWWNHLHNLGFPDIEEGKFMQTVETDENIQQMMVNWVDKLITFIKKWDIPAKRFNKLMEIIGENRKKYERDGWRFWIYNSNCVVCDSHLSAIGNPFIDTYNENGKISIRLGNRDKNGEMQKKIVAELKMPTDEIVGNDTRTEYASFDENTSDEIVMTKVAELIDKLSQIK